MHDVLGICVNFPFIYFILHDADHVRTYEMSKYCSLYAATNAK